MAWRRPPKIAPRQLARTPQACPEDAAAAHAARQEAAAESGTSRLSSLSRPKHGVEVKARRNPKQVREAALAKKMAAQRGNAPPAGGAGPPRVRTTVTKTKSTPGGGAETTTVERVASGPAVYKPRYNRQKVLHPEDVYREAKKQPPCKPGAACPKIKKGEFYSKEVVGLWEQWQQWNEYNEEIKSWKQNRPHVSQKEKDDRAFKRWFEKEEETHERLFKAGKSQVMPFHMRPEPSEKKVKKKAAVRSPQRRELPKTPKGKKRYEEKDCCGNYIRYNSVKDPNPEDLYNAQGLNPPEYVQPPLREDGTFKKPNERTEEETEAFLKYRKWEELYFRQQAWDNDKKWAGDPRIQELFKIKTPSRGGRVADVTNPQARAEARAAERAGRKAAADQARRSKMSQGDRAAGANMRKMSGVARVAMEAAARREAADRAAEEAQCAALQQRQKSFLRRGQRAPPAVTGRGRVDVSRVQSRIGAALRQQRQQQQQAAAMAQCPAEAPPPEPEAEPYDIPPTPGMPYEVYQHNLETQAMRKRAKAYCEKMTNQIARHLNLSGQMGHHPTTIHFFDKGERPYPVTGEDVAILNYDNRLPPASLFGGPRGDDEDEVQGCDEPSLGWFEPDEPISPFGKTFTHMHHPSPPKSISKGRLPWQPMHPNDARQMQYDMDEDEFWFAEQELERLDDKAYRDHCAQEHMERPLRDRRAQMAAQTDINLLHPSVFRSNIREREEQTAFRQELASNLGDWAQAVQAECPLPAIEYQPVTRAWDIPSPDCSPSPPRPVRVEQLIDLDGSCAYPTPRAPPLPPLPYAECAPTPTAPPLSSPFELPERFYPGSVNPFLERARAAIEAPCAHIPFRGEEIAAQAQRTAAAAQPREPPVIFTGWDPQDFIQDLRQQAYLDQELEDVQLSPCTPQAEQSWQYPDFRQMVGPQYGALYHEHIRQPQLGPWHYTPPQGRSRRHFNWEGSGAPHEGDLCDF